MRLLVLFSAWVPDDSENSRRWLEWYRQVLAEAYGGDDKIVAINFGSHALAATIFGQLPALVGCEAVPEHLHIDSDAAGFQVALDASRARLDAYDAVMFMHTKGMSYRFGDFDGMRPLLRSTIFDRDAVLDRIRAQNAALVCFRGHMADTGGSIHACERFAREIGIEAPPFNFGATLTLYCVPTGILRRFVQRLPEAYLRQNLAGLHQNRFFFEGIVPSMLVMLGAMPVFMEAPAFDPDLNDSVSYNARPAHNSALVAREYVRRQHHGAGYRQVPIPYVFGEIQPGQAPLLSFAV